MDDNQLYDTTLIVIFSVLCCPVICVVLILCVALCIGGLAGCMAVCTTGTNLLFLPCRIITAWFVGVSREDRRYVYDMVRRRNRGMHVDFELVDADSSP